METTGSVWFIRHVALIGLDESLVSVVDTQGVKDPSPFWREAKETCDACFAGPDVGGEVLGEGDGDRLENPAKRSRKSPGKKPARGRSRRMKLRGPMRVQSILLSKEYFTKSEAKDWVKEHGFLARKVETQKNYYRVRQFDPRRVQEGTFRTRKVRGGVLFVFGADLG